MAPITPIGLGSRHDAGGEIIPGAKAGARADEPTTRCRSIPRSGNCQPTPDIDPEHAYSLADSLTSRSLTIR